MPQERSQRDTTQEETEIGILYTGTLVPDVDANKALIRNKRVTEEGFQVDGHAHFVVDPPTPFTSPLPTLAEEREYDIRERNNLLITIENGQDGAVTFNIFGRHTASGTRFLLKAVGSIASLASAAPETLTDPWAFLVISASSDSGGQTGSVIVKVQEQT